MEQFSRETEEATAYCTYCPKMCRFSCPAAEAEHRETVTPWGMMRLLEFVRDGSVEPSDDVAETFYHCMGCRRCQEWCLHDNDVPSAMWEARARMRELGHVPEALEGFCETFREHRAPRGDLPELGEVHGYSADEVFDQRSTVVYVPDCETRYDAPRDVVRAGLLFEMFHGSKVALYTRRDRRTGESGLGCCGFPLLSAGDVDGYEHHRRELNAAVTDADVVVTECAAMAALYRDDTSWGRSGAIEVEHVIEFLADRVDSVDVREPVELDDSLLHDSCFVGRQLELYDEVRELLEGLCEASPGEFDVAREEAPCCGGPSHYHLVAPEASERLAADRLEELDRDGGERVVCSAATCEKAFERVDEGVAEDVMEVAFRAFGL